ncbi:MULTISPECIES: HAD family hydrolase [Catenuloplanes]|uniref:HAD family hydrolase n=1 Tax=Catenuloplanes TaxID=33874 RepID=UPI0035B5468B
MSDRYEKGAPVPRIRKVTVSTDARGHTAGWVSTDLEAALVPRPDPGAAAFFDLDNTMMQGASLYWFARGLASRRYFTARDVARFAWQQARFRLISEHRGHISSAKDIALAFFHGWKVEDVERLAEEIFEESMAARIWPGTHALAKTHLDGGERVWLVTAAPIEIGRVIAQRLGLTGAIGTVAEIVDGAYTGRLVGDMMHGAAKADAVRQLAVVEGLNLKRCTAYSDSANDMPMLTSVGNAVATNPDAALRRIARVRGWQVRDFRTARKAARIAVPVAVATGLVAGTALTVALRRRAAR